MTQPPSAPVPSAARTDLFNQRDIDTLLAHGAMHFDGMVLSGKRLDDAELARGTYRGTTFDSCVLSRAVGARAEMAETPDFDRTSFERGTLDALVFRNWTMRRTAFRNARMHDPTFVNVRIDDGDQDSHLHFMAVHVEDGTFSGGDVGGIYGGRMHSTHFLKTQFQDLRFDGTLLYGSSFQSCTFSGGWWRGVAFLDDEATPCTLEGGRFHDMEIRSGNWRQVRFAPIYGIDKTVFSKVTFLNVLFDGATVDAHFQDGCEIRSYGTFYTNIQFGTSIFEATTFRAASPTTPLQLRGCDFRQVEFRQDVVFDGCDLRGARFPSGIGHVQFINCTPARPDVSGTDEA